MPRFYNLVLTNPATGKTATRADGTPYIWGTNSAAGNAYDPGATEIEFNVQVSSYDQPVGGSSITLYGVPIQDILQASDFAGPSPGKGYVASLYGGMSAGLPLTNPKQAGLLTQGVIVQSWANWVGTEQDLNFVLSTSTYTPNNPGNIVLNWRANTPLSQALADCFSTAYPGVKQNIQISQKLVLTHDEVGFYLTLEALAQTVQNITKNQIVSDDYGGVTIAYQGGQLYVFDGTVAPTAAPVQLNFNDLIGQPKWIDVNSMQVTTVLRGDLQLSSIIKMPDYKVTVNGKIIDVGGSPGTVITTGQSAPNGLKYKSTFHGTFVITAVRHIGSLRDANGTSWVSVFNCAPYSGPAPSSLT